MKDLVYVKNNNTNTETILTIGMFNILKNMFSENSSYKYLSTEEAKELSK